MVKNKEKKVLQEVEKTLKEASGSSHRFASLSPKLIGTLADEVAKTLVRRLPNLVLHPTKRKVRVAKANKKIEKALFLDTSAIIDGRIFDVFHLGLINGEVVVLESILLELKRIADSQDYVKRERGRNGLQFLEKLKKVKGIKVSVLALGEEKKYSNFDIKEVDEILIKVAKSCKGRVITCDYNLEKRASIQGVTVINVNALANALKVRAIPGQTLHVQVLHKGKDPTQGVAYLDDGTMIVVEQAYEMVGKTIDVVVSRVIQTAAGRILFSKRI